MTVVVECRWCGAEFRPPPPTKGGSKKKEDRPVVLVHADHEINCEKNPHRPEREKESKAWNPVPWKLSVGGRRPVLRSHLLTFVGGPLDTRQTPLVNYLVDGSAVAVEPPLRLAGPVTEDSKGRAVSRYMGHYQLKLKVLPDVDGPGRYCPVYVWTQTIQPKRRLPDHPSFVELYPELAAMLDIYNEEELPSEEEREERNDG